MGSNKGGIKADKDSLKDSSSEFEIMRHIIFLLLIFFNIKFIIFKIAAKLKKIEKLLKLPQYLILNSKKRSKDVKN